MSGIRQDFKQMKSADFKSRIILNRSINKELDIERLKVKKFVINLRVSNRVQIIENNKYLNRKDIETLRLIDLRLDDLENN